MSATLPRIDYAAHPAYAPFAGAENEPGARDEALAMLQPLIDRMAMIESQRVDRFGYRFGAATQGARELVDSGITRDILPAAAMDRIDQESAAIFEDLRAGIRNAGTTGAPVSFKTVHRTLDAEADAAIWSAVDDALRAAGVFETAGSYFSGSDAIINSLALFLNPDNQDWARNIFRDCDHQTPETVGFHIDSNGKCYLKTILYLNDVGPDQGPLGIVPESQTWEMGSRDRVVRRAFDRSKLLSRHGDARRHLMALPEELRSKAEFGGDMIAGTPETQDLLNRELISTGPRGLYNLFDPDAIHRGGNVRSGERRVVQVTIRTVY